MDKIREEREQAAEEPATKKQRNFLRKLGVDVDDEDNLTKQRASELIDQELAKDNGEV